MDAVRPLQPQVPDLCTSPTLLYFFIFIEILKYREIHYGINYNLCVKAVKNSVNCSSSTYPQKLRFPSCKQGRTDFGLTDEIFLGHVRCLIENLVFRSENRKTSINNKRYLSALPNSTKPIILERY